MRYINPRLTLTLTTENSQSLSLVHVQTMVEALVVNQGCGALVFCGTPTPGLEI